MIVQFEQFTLTEYEPEALLFFCELPQLANKAAAPIIMNGIIPPSIDSCSDKVKSTVFIILALQIPKLNYYSLSLNQ